MNWSGRVKIIGLVIGSGTFGGMVRVHRPNGTYWNLDQTCFQCVISQKSTNSSHIERMWRGFCPKSQRSNIKVDIPSPVGYKQTVKILQAYIYD